MSLFTKIKIGGIGLACVVALIVFFQNTAEVPLKFLWFTEWHMPLAVLLLLVVAFGFGLGVAGSRILHWRRSRKD